MQAQNSQFDPSQLPPQMASRIVIGENGCWIWTGAHTPRGYGQLGLKSLGIRRTRYTHRHSYEMLIGPIPDGLHVLHHCDNPPCCNPEHLFVGTHSDNMRDMLAKGRRAYTNAPRGERNGRARLTADDVRAIRARYAKGGIGTRTLAAEYNMSRHAIVAAIKGENWSHVI